MRKRDRLYRITAFAVLLGLIGQLVLVPVSVSATPTAQPASNTAALTDIISAPQRALTAPQAASAPLSIARVQSSYQGNDTSTITFVITNNLPPTRLPNIAPGANVTDTVNALAVFDVTDDVNTLRNLTVEETLINGTTLIDASGSPSVAGNTLTWNLPDLPPLASATVTVTVQTPTATGDFVALATGAVVDAEQWNNPVSAQARPATIVPSGFDAALTASTVDADIDDADMLWASTAFDQDPSAAFEYVRGLTYDPYAGSVRGTRGTLWGQAGNTVDQSSLLIAMLRAAGIPARYRHGTLSQAHAQTLLATMFPPAEGLAGYLPDDVQTADPVNDPDLIALASDHWWVEAYLPGQGWTDLDPAFPAAQPGDVFATPGDNDRITELPDSLQFEITFVLEVEQYNQFPIGGVSLSSFTPLTATFRLSELAARPVTFGHVVNTLAQGGLAYTTVTHTYTPYIDVGGQNFLTTGDTFQDLLTNFPLASKFTTAQWLTISVTDPNGTTESFRRELKDLMGLDVRHNGGSPILSTPADNRPFTSFNDAFATWFLPNEVRATQFAQRLGATSTYAILAAAAEADALPTSTATPEEQAAYADFNLTHYLARNQRYAAAGLEFAELTDPATRDIEEYLRVKLFYDRPRIIITSSTEQADGSTTVSLDLRSTTAHAIVYPGQAVDADKTAQWIKGIIESYHEEEIGGRLAEAFPIATTRIFDEMAAQSIEPVLVTPNTSYLLDLYLADSASYAYAQEALLEGKHVLIPTAPVLVDGEPTLGWWEIDPETGVAVGVLENGQHGALEYELIGILIGFWGELDAANTVGKAVKDLWDCMARTIVPALQGNPGGGASCIDGWSPPNTGNPPWLPGLFPSRLLPTPSTSGTDSWRFLPAYQCPVDNCGVEQFVLPYPGQAPIPLPEMTFGYNDRFGGEMQSGRVITATDNGGGGAPAFSLSTSPGSGIARPGQVANFDVTVDANFDGPINTLVYAPEGLQVRFEASGLAAVTPRPGTLPGDYTLSLVAQSNADPDVIATASYTLTVPDEGTLYLGWQAEPNISVPMDGALFKAVTNETNDGEPEFPDSAFTLNIANYSGQEKALSLSATGAPAGWLVFNGYQQTATTVTLGPNERTAVGLYVVPTSAPAPGTSFTIDFQLSDGLGGSANASIPWTMPGQAHNFVEITPEDIYLGSTSSTDFSVTMTNVGNETGSFDLTATLPPVTATVTGLPASVSLAVDETDEVTGTLTTTGVPIGTRFPLRVSSPAPGSYTQHALANVQIVSDLTEDVFLASRNAKNVCTAGEPGLSDTLHALALAMVQLEITCNAGSCEPYFRDQVVDAAYTVAAYGGLVAPELSGTDAVFAAAQDLAAHDDDTDILADLVALSAAVSTLEEEVCGWSLYNPKLQWTPNFDAALLGDTTTYSLTLTNEGSVATTYAITAELLTGPATSQVTLNPGEVHEVAYPVTPSALGTYLLDATATAINTGMSVDVEAAAQAGLNVVDRFVQLTRVTPDPAFVETSTSSTEVSIDVVNVANVELATTARLTIWEPGGVSTHTVDLPLTVLRGDERTYPLTTVDTSGWAEGVYTITVELLDSSLALIPDGSGYGYFAVGQALGASHTVSPTVVAPGTVTVTTVITTEILADTVLTGDQPSARSPQPSTFNLQPSTPPATPPLPHTPTPNLPTSTTAITRTEDTSPTIAYSGTWTTVENIFSGHTSDGRYTWSETAGNTATFAFTGTWVHIGFAISSRNGHAEILIDGNSQGIVELYYPDRLCYNALCLASFAYGGLSDGPHTLEIIVTGTQHPNAEGTQVRLDYIDTWDGTAYPDGTFEETDARVWHRDSEWTLTAEAAASGGYFLRGTELETVWFPFTGDSVSFVGLDRLQGHTVKVYVDGVWQGDILNYNVTPVSDTTSFSGFGPGPHVLQVSGFREDPGIDAFVTPAVGPDYDPPTYTGFVRYEEDDPALRYNGYEVDLRPRSWASANAPQASEFSYMSSSTLSDTVTLDFYGSWINIGLRTRNRGGLADVTVDGVSLGTINAYSDEFEGTVSYQFDLITGTHTLTITVLDQSDPVNTYNEVYLDYIEIWDGSPVTDTFQNAFKAEESGRVLVSSAVRDGYEENAIRGDFVNSGLPNSQANVWYNFIGNSVTVYGLTTIYGSDAEVYIDGVLTDTIDVDYPFSVQPLAFHYTGLDDGPHTVRVHNADSMRLDGFASNQPETAYQPITEWWDDTPQGNGASFFGTVGIASGMTAADLEGDGSVEIVVTADDMINFGTLFVYRGDGADTGDGDPIIWSHDFGGGAFRTWVSSPAIADLDGQPGAEIVVAAGDELWAFHSDGSTYWTITGTTYIFETLTAPAIANLDLDPDPEIVVNLDDTLEIREHDGTLIWNTVYPDHVNPPVLADLTGDGFLDILVTGWDDDVILYDYNFGTPQIEWTQTLSSTMDGTFGAPAVADIDGQQPGGDPDPEVAIASNGRLTVLNGEDGSVVWSVPLDPGNPGGVSIADLDGDGEVEIVTGMRYEFETDRFGKIYALNADGTLLWDAIAEDSSSANNASVLDLDGDGVYEVAWNGKEMGFTIYNGADGSVRFNEPLLNSVTGTDYPIFADVDGDSYAEVVVAALRGLRVVGFDGVWGNARPVWHQHSYHITDINDNLTVPTAELDSWEVHNTYRTQTPMRSPMPVHDVTLTHTVGITDVTVFTGTFNVDPDTQADPVYTWEYQQTTAYPVVTRTFVTELADMQPGEAREVAQGTEVVYTLPSGSNQLVLPPLYVSAPHIVVVTPTAHTTGSGGTVFFDVLLTNPGTAPDTYALTVAGLPDGWAQLVASADVPAGGEVTVPMTVTVPDEATVQMLDFAVGATNGAGGQDQATATLTIIDTMDVVIAPETQSATTGDPLTYTLIITNNESVTRTYTLASTGLASVSLPVTVTVPPGEAVTLNFEVLAQVEGPNPFTVSATSSSGTESATAVAEGAGSWIVVAALSPSPAAGGPGASTVMTLTVTNLGDQADVYDLAPQVPPGWSAGLVSLGQPVSSLSLPAGAFNSTNLRLVVTPDTGAVPGSYPLTVTVTSQAHPGVQAAAAGVLDVGTRGLTVEIVPGDRTLDPRSAATWDVTITNRGSVADSYDLAVSGVLGVFGTLADTTNLLNPGQSQVVQLTADNLDLLLHGTYAVAVTATSQGDGAVAAEATAEVTLDTFEDVAVRWLPAAQTITDTLTTSFLMVVTNTGNVETSFTLTASNPSLLVALPPTEVLLPAHSVASVPVAVTAPGAGTYVLDGSATSAGAVATQPATLTVVADNVAPVANAGVDQIVEVSATVTLDGSASYDPDGDEPLGYGWEQTGGTPVSLSSTTVVSPAFVAPSAPSVLTFTLTVTDSLGLVDPTPDVIVVNARNYTYLPLVLKSHE